MSASPGEQSRNKYGRLFALLAVLAGLSFYWLKLPKDAHRQSQMETEYRLYKSEVRSDVRLDLAELGSIASESDLRAIYPRVQLQCQSDWTGIPGAKTACAMYTKSVNAVPAMYLNFIFAEHGLMRVTVAVPQEAYEDALGFLNQTLGQPIAEQSKAVAGIRLLGWKLSDGATVFYNRDKPTEAFEPSSIQWLPKNGCGGQPCLR